jgi:hypothetical protein
MTLVLKYSGTEHKIDAIAARQTAKQKQLANLSAVKSFLIIGAGVKLTISIERYILSNYPN